MTDTPEDKTDLFLRLLMSHHGQLFAYIFTLVPNYSDAEDILQDLSVVLMRQFEKFDPESNFLAWARTVAFYEVLNFRKKKSRQPVLFSDETLKAIAHFCEKTQTSRDGILEAAELCIEKLPERDKQLILLRYDQGITTKKIAERLGVSIYSVYRAVERIHHVLLRCIRRTLSPEL